jgi:hypothetical protein
MRRMLHIAMALAIGAPDAHGQSLDFFIDGNHLHRYCTANTNDAAFERQKDFCYGYSTGVVDEWVATRRLNNKESCLRQLFVSERLKYTVVHFMDAHPQIWDYPAADIIAAALVDAYPDCR